jgi:hypothetical protein
MGGSDTLGQEGEMFWSPIIKQALRSLTELESFFHCLILPTKPKSSFPATNGSSQQKHSPVGWLNKVVPPIILGYVSPIKHSSFLNTPLPN